MGNTSNKIFLSFSCNKRVFSIKKIPVSYLHSIKIMCFDFAGPDSFLECQRFKYQAAPRPNGLQGSRNVGIPRMDLNTEETRIIFIFIALI